MRVERRGGGKEKERIGGNEIGTEEEGERDRKKKSNEEEEKLTISRLVVGKDRGETNI